MLFTVEEVYGCIAKRTVLFLRYLTQRSTIVVSCMRLSLVQSSMAAIWKVARGITHR